MEDWSRRRRRSCEDAIEHERVDVEVKIQGEQQMLAIGRALMGNPSLLLMDEPTQGLAPLVIRNLGEQIRRLQTEGVTILLSEQNVAFAGPLANRVYVIDHGNIRFEGTLRDLEANAEVRRRYLLT